jgi:hypothetical protein
LSVTILSEGFEGIFPEDNGWSVGDSNPFGTDAYWNDVDSAFGGEGTHSGSWKGYCADIGNGGTYSDPAYQNDMTAYMSKTIDLSGYSSAMLSFWHKIPSIEAGYDHARVYIDSDLVYDRSSALPSWTQEAFSLNSYVGGTHTLKFEFYSDYSNTAEGWYLDDILVTAEPALPDLYDEGDSLSSFNPDYVASPGSAGAGQPWDATFLIRNGGNLAAGGFWVDYYASPTIFIGPADHYLGSVYIAGIEAFSYAQADLHLTSFPGGIPSGGYYVGIIIDPDNTVTESNESNNAGVDLDDYPLTVALVDAYEPNDSFAAAYNLGTRGYFYDSGLTIHAPGNDDYFRFTAGGTGPADINVYFSHAAGDIDLYVYDAGQTPVGSSSSTDDDEFVSIPVAGGQTYYVKVVGYGGATNPNYSLEINAPSSPPLDNYEPNDSFAAAYNLGTRGYFYESGLNIHEAGNDDYFRFTAGATGQADVNVYFSQAAGDIDLYVYDAGQTPVGSSSSTDDDEFVSIPVAGGQTYYVKVVGYGGATNPNYSLEIDAPLPAAYFGDYNQDGFVNAADYTVWRNTSGQTVLAPYTGADGDGDRMIDRDDFLLWKAHYGETVPVPGSGASVDGGQLQGSITIGTAAPEGYPAGGGTHDVELREMRQTQPDLRTPITHMMRDQTFDLAQRALTPTLSHRERAFSAERDSFEHDAALLRWLDARRTMGFRGSANWVAEFTPEDGLADAAVETEFDSIDTAFDLLAAAI